MIMRVNQIDIFSDFYQKILNELYDQEAQKIMTKCALIINRTYPTLKVRTLDYQIWQMMSSKLTKK